MLHWVRQRLQTQLLQALILLLLFYLHLLLLLLLLLVLLFSLLFLLDARLLLKMRPPLILNLIEQGHKPLVLSLLVKPLKDQVPLLLNRLGLPELAPDLEVDLPDALEQLGDIGPVGRVGRGASAVLCLLAELDDCLALLPHVLYYCQPGEVPAEGQLLLQGPALVASQLAWTQHAPLVAALDRDDCAVAGVAPDASGHDQPRLQG
jgi:hypothetical protein